MTTCNYIEQYTINEKDELDRKNCIKNFYFVQVQAEKFNSKNRYDSLGSILIKKEYSFQESYPIEINTHDGKDVYKIDVYKKNSTRFQLISVLSEGAKRDDVEIHYKNGSVYQIIGLRKGSPKTHFDLVSALYYHSNDYKAALYLYKNEHEKQLVNNNYNQSLSSINPITPAFQPSAYGVNGWMNMDDCLENELFSGLGIPLGHIKSHDDQYNYQLYYQDERHLITIAPNGTGKGTCAQIPVLLKYDAPMLVIDPKGENAAVTAKHRKVNMKHDVLILNPFNTLDEHFASEGFKSEETNCFESACFNPLATLNPDDDGFVSDVAALSESLIDGESKDPFWTDSARELVTCLILYICIADDYKDKKNLIEMRRLLTEDKEKFAKTMSVIAALPFAPVAQKAKRFIEDNKTNQSIISTAITQTSFLDDPKLAKNLSSNDIDFTSLKEGKTTIYVILPAKLLLVYSKWFKLVVTSALNALMSTHSQGNKRVLIMLDECPILGRLSCIETAVGLARGYGIQLWTFWQDIHQLYDVYKTRAESFLANAGVQQYFTPNDMAVAEKLSKRLGDNSIFTRNISYQFPGNNNSNQTLSFSESPIPFLNPVNLFGLPKEKQLLFLAGKERSILGEKIPYYECDICKERASKNPYL